MNRPSSSQRYWKNNLIVITVLLTIWAIVSCICGILLIEPLNEFKFGQLPFGFWVANQGSMITFVILILVYAVVMDGIDRKFQKESRGNRRDD